MHVCLVSGGVGCYIRLWTRHGHKLGMSVIVCVCACVIHCMYVCVSSGGVDCYIRLWTRHGHKLGMSVILCVYEWSLYAFVNVCMYGWSKWRHGLIHT